MEEIMQLNDNNGFLYVDERVTRPGIQLTLEGKRGTSSSVMLDPHEVENLITALAKKAGLKIVREI